MKAENLQLAAKYNFFQLSNIPDHIRNDNWFSERLEDYKLAFERTKLPDGLTQLKNVEVGVFGEATKDTNYKGEHRAYYFKDWYILVFSPNCEVPLMLMSYKGKHYLHPIYSFVRQVQGVTTSEQRKPYLSKIAEPNRIGVFTERKIADWVEYCNLYIDACKQSSDALQSKEQENKKYIQSVIDSLPGAKIETVRNWTTIETKLFSIEFELLDGGGYLNKKVGYKGSIEDIIRLQL